VSGQPSAPDVKILMTLLLRRLSTLHPDVVKPDDAERIAACEDVALVGARVACVIARRVGVTKEDVETMVAEASRPLRTAVTPGRAADFDTGVIAEDRVPEALAALQRIDEALSDPARGPCFPDWFRTGFWPDLLRRVAMGGRVSPRDMALMRVALETASGRRG
jgi:hypothetical protein